MDNIVDEEMIRASQRGDRVAFASLLELIYDLIFRFALKWSGNRVDAEDITQQVCIKLASVIQQFTFKSQFTTWLYRVVMNCAHDWGRKHRRHQHDQYSEINDEASAGQSDACIESPTELDRVLKLVDNMGKDFKDTLLLVHAEGLSHREAAEVLDVKESTVSWRLHDVKKRLSALEQSSMEATP